MLARVPAVSCLVGIAGSWGLYHLLGLVELGKLHLLTSKKGPYLGGQHWRGLSA